MRDSAWSDASRSETALSYHGRSCEASCSGLSGTTGSVSSGWVMLDVLDRRSEDAALTSE